MIAFIFTENQADSHLKNILAKLRDAVPTRKKQKSAQVFLLNDDWNTPDYVAYVVCGALNISRSEAHKFMSEAHNTGRSLIFTGPEAEAQIIVKTITQAGADPKTIELGAKPIGVDLQLVDEEG